MLVYVLVASLAGVLTAIGSWIVWKMGIKYRIYPQVRSRDIHSRPTPRLGGVAMLVAILITIFTASQIPFFASVFTGNSRLLGVLLAAIIITVVGFVDDLFDLHWAIKLLAQLLVAVLVSLLGVKVLFNPETGLTVIPGWLSFVLGVVLLVLTMNAINFIDGLDGLVAGVGLIGNAGFFVYIYFFTREFSPSNYFNLAGLLAAVLAGVCLGFLPFNWRPARLFMGDSGALLIGLLMAVSGITVTGQIDTEVLAAKSRLVPAFLPILLPFAIMALPMLDLALAVLRRLFAGKSPFYADKKHLHHRMLALGHSPLSAVVVFYAWTGVIVAGFMLFFFTSSLWAGLLLGLGSLVCLGFTFAPWVKRKIGQR